MIKKDIFSITSEKNDLHYLKILHKYGSEIERLSYQHPYFTRKLPKEKFIGEARSAIPSLSQIVSLIELIVQCGALLIKKKYIVFEKDINNFNISRENISFVFDPEDKRSDNYCLEDDIEEQIKKRKEILKTFFRELIKEKKIQFIQSNIAQIFKCIKNSIEQIIINADKEIQKLNIQK